MVDITQGPTLTDWNTHRQRIIELYQIHPLGGVRKKMLIDHGFLASERMYLSRLKQWNIMKNWKAAEKNQLLRELTNPTPAGYVALYDSLGEDQRRKLKRHIKGQVSESFDTEDSHPYLEILSGSEPEIDYNTGPFSSTEATRSSSPDLETDSHERGELKASADDKWPAGYESVLAQVGSLFSTMTLSVDALCSSNVDPGLETMDVALKAISMMLAGMVIPDATVASGQTSKFWSDIDDSIYLLKVSSPYRAWLTIDKACASAFTMDFESISCVQAIFSILSPINTKHCPELRLELLTYLGKLVETKHGPRHPLAVLTATLKSDSKARDVSERSLRFILDSLCGQFGSCHHISIKAHSNLVKLLRRDHDFDAALRNAQQLFNVASPSPEISMLIKRKAAQELRHIYMDMSDWGKALQFCCIAIGKPGEGNPETLRQYRDACAVYTMEDISKIYGVLGDVALSENWLQEALTIALEVWPNRGSSIDHIVDKLKAVPQQYERPGGVGLWRASSLLQTVV